MGQLENAAEPNLRPLQPHLKLEALIKYFDSRVSLLWKMLLPFHCRSLKYLDHAPQNKTKAHRIALLL